MTGLPESATPSFHIQLSSPIEEQTITQLSDPLDPNKDKSFAEFKGVETSVATLVVKAFDADIPLGSSTLYDVKPLCDIDVLRGGERKVSHLDIAIVPGLGGHMDDIIIEEEVFQDAKSSDEGEEVQAGDDAGENKAEPVVAKEAEQTEEITNDDSDKVEEELAEEQVDETKEDVEEDTSEEKSEEQVHESKEDVQEETSEEKPTDAEEEKEESAVSPETVTETEIERDNDVSEVNVETEAKSDEASTPAAEEFNEEPEAKEDEATPAAPTSDSEQKDAPTATSPILVPSCVVQMRIEYNPSVKDQKDELYDLLNKASKRKAMAVDKLRKSASALSRASSTQESSAIVKKEKAVKSGFLNKKPVVKKEIFLVRFYNKALGPDSFARKVFPIAKNYILFFGGVALMHFQGQQLALPPPV